jgi:hypothetical protein
MQNAYPGSVMSASRRMCGDRMIRIWADDPAVWIQQASSERQVVARYVYGGSRSRLVSASL